MSADSSLPATRLRKSGLPAGSKCSTSTTYLKIVHGYSGSNWMQSNDLCPGRL